MAAAAGSLLQITAVLALLLAFGLPCGAAASIDDLTGPWQLLVDDYPVLTKSNVVRAYHPFQKHAGNPVMVPDQPWEQPLVYLYGTVLPNETRTGYRMWYHFLRTNNASNCTNWSNEAYATSTNGINWVKAPLYIRSTCGSSSNNMYYTRTSGGGMTSVIQTPWEPDPAQRYKFMNYDSGGFYAAWSPDGLHLTDAPNNPVFTGGGDVGQFSWDPHSQIYRGYVKNAWYDWNGRKRRAVALTTTTNITSWPQESLVLWPDPYDDRWIIPGSVQRTHFYGLSAFAYESMYIGLLWIFRATETDGSDPGYLIGPCFVELISSHDGVHWTREEPDRPPILPLGAAGAWDDGMVFTARAPVVEGDTLKLWYGGFDQVHGTALTKTKGAIGLATLRKDGFASLDAGATAGTILTKPLIATGGTLQVNCATSGGWLKVEVLDGSGSVLPGYSQADCVPLTGNSLTQAVAWTGHATLPAGASNISLRFILQNASLYSFMAGPASAVVDVPTITTHPANQLVAPGVTASFSVIASALTPLSYQWQKNMVNLANGGRYSGCSTATLTITAAESADAALYRCIVTNAYGSATSSGATLSVISNAFGTVTLTNIPALSGDTANEARAITPDGRYVVGNSSTNKAFLYDSTSRRLVRVVGSDNIAAKSLTGVSYAQTQIIVSGLASNNGRFTAWMTPDGGVSWGSAVQYSTSTKLPTVPAANGLAAAADGSLYWTWTDEGTGATDNWGFRVGRFTGTWPMTYTFGQKDVPKPDTCQMNGISGAGRAVGWRRNGTTLAHANYISDSSGAVNWNCAGLDGTTAGQGFCVSANGTTLFGISPLVVGGATNNHGYKAVFDATFPGPATQLSLAQLPNFSDTTGSVNLAIPYGCTADGRFAVGMNYRGVEKAVLWDTSNTNVTKWSVTDLTEVAVATGSQGIFARLARAYSVGTNAAGNLVIAGVGVDTNTPANTRAFLMSISPPQAVVVVPPQIAVAGSAAAGFTFTFNTVASASTWYYLEYTTNLPPLAAWTAIAATPGNGGLATLSDPTPVGSQRFYRVRVQ